MTDLGTLGGDYAAAFAINKSGAIAGESNYTVGGSLFAMRWTAPAALSSWATRTSLPSARRSLATATASGLLYAIGGANSAGTALKTVQVYNPSTNAWTTKASLPAARPFGNGATHISGTIYLPGGQDAAGVITRTLYAYRISTNTWSTKANMPVFSGCGGSGVISGKLYVFSGCTKTATGPQTAAALLHRYDPATNTWTTLRDAPVGSRAAGGDGCRRQALRGRGQLRRRHRHRPSRRVQPGHQQLVHGRFDADAQSGQLPAA